MEEKIKRIKSLYRMSHQDLQQAYQDNECSDSLFNYQKGYVAAMEAVLRIFNISISEALRKD